MCWLFVTCVSVVQSLLLFGKLKSLDLTVKNMHSDSVNTSGQHCCNYSNLDPWVFFSWVSVVRRNALRLISFLFWPRFGATNRASSSAAARTPAGCGDGARYYHIMTVPALKTRAAVSPGIDAQPRQKQRAVNGKPTTARHFFIWFFFCLFFTKWLLFCLHHVQTLSNNNKVWQLQLLCSCFGQTKSSHIYLCVYIAELLSI